MLCFFVLASQSDFNIIPSFSFCASYPQPDASTRALLTREVAFNEIVPLNQTLGLRLDLNQKATVADWWLAYGAAAQLSAANKTFSTLTGASISAEAEKALASAAVDRVNTALYADARKFVASKSNYMPAPLQYTTGAVFSSRDFGSGVTDAIKKASQLVDEAAAIPVSQSSISEIFHILMKARNELREIASTLRVEADARQSDVEAGLLSQSWSTLMSSGASKADVDAAVKFIQENNSVANGSKPLEWDSLISATLPSEAKQMEEVLTKLSQVVSSIPQPLFDAELKRRDTIVADGAFPQYDQAFVRA